jgi:hypothetical protein
VSYVLISHSLKVRRAEGNIKLWISLSVIILLFPVISGKRKTTSSHLYSIWVFHRGDYKKFFILGYNALWSYESQLTLWRNILPPFSGSKSELCLLPASCWILALLNLQPRRWSKMSVGFPWTTWRHMSQNCRQVFLLIQDSLLHFLWSSYFIWHLTGIQR